MKNYVVDSSGWIEYFSAGSKSAQYEKYISHAEKIILPSVVLFEVYRKIKKVRGEEDALFVITQMQKCSQIPFDAHIALQAADLSLRHSLAMADAIVYATAQIHKVELITSDNDFRKLPDVVVI